MSKSVYSYDPDEDEPTTKRPAWTIPTTTLSTKALAACRRKFFQGQRKHGGEFEQWERIESKVIGATEDAYLYKRWIENCIAWAVGMNAKTNIISFEKLMHLIENDEKRIATTASRRTQWLAERRIVPSIDFKKEFEADE